MAPLVNVTNVLASSGTSGGSSLAHKEACGEAKHAVRDMHPLSTKDLESVALAQPFVQQQQRDMASQSMTGQNCSYLRHNLHDEEDSADLQKPDGLLEDCKGCNLARV